MGVILFILLFVTGFVVVASIADNESLALEPVAQRTEEPVRAGTTAGAFTAIGTLAFYPNNVGLVPYLFYQDNAGRTVSKALSFPDGPPAHFSSWSGARILVTGTLVLEHVVVSRISYIAGP